MNFKSGLRFAEIWTGRIRGRIFFLNSHNGLYAIADFFFYSISHLSLIYLPQKVLFFLQFANIFYISNKTNHWSTLNQNNLVVQTFEKLTITSKNLTKIRDQDLKKGSQIVNMASYSIRLFTIP